MARSFILYPDAHGIARGKIINGKINPEVEIGCASGVFSKDIFGIPQIFKTLATPFGAADIKIRPEDGTILDFEPNSNFLLGVSSIAIGTVTDPLQCPHPLDFRRILRDHIKQNQTLNQYSFGAELEFFLQPHESSLSLRADGQAYAFSSALNLQKCLADMMNALDHVGILWNEFSQENDSNQFEFSLPHSTPLEQADRIFLARFILRSVAAFHGLRCTFTAVVNKAGSPSSLHLHISNNSHSSSVNKLCSGVASTLFGSFLALCPTQNSRLVEKIDSFSSKKINVGEGDRFKAVRIIKTKNGDRVELRTPTSDANPYLAILMILGGIQHGSDSIANEELFTFERDIEWGFEESIDTFLKDKVVRKLLVHDTIDLYTAMKRLEGMKSTKLGFEDEVSMLKAVI